MPNNNNREKPVNTDDIAPKEMAQRRGCTVKYIYDLLAAGRIPGARKVGKKWAIPARALKELGGRHHLVRRRP
jgi:excisionase family DNA binding protein